MDFGEDPRLGGVSRWEKATRVFDPDGCYLKTKYIPIAMNMAMNIKNGNGLDFFCGLGPVTKTPDNKIFSFSDNLDIVLMLSKSQVFASTPSKLFRRGAATLRDPRIRIQIQFCRELNQFTPSSARNINLSC